MENQELYKQAILDAKAVRETAMAAAKESLAEAFEPRIKEMLRLKLSEELEEAKEEVEEAEDKMEEGKYSKMEEGDYSEMEEAADMEESTLDEILAELEAMSEEPAKDKMEEDLEEASILTDPNFIGGLSALLGVGGAMASAIFKDLKSAKTPEEKKQVLQQAANSISKATGGDDATNLEEASILTDPNFIGGLAALLGVGGAMASAILKDLKSANTPEEKKQVLQQAANSVSKAAGGSDSLMEAEEDEADEEMEAGEEAGTEEAGEDEKVVELTVGELKDLFRDVFAQVQGGADMMAGAGEMEMSGEEGGEELSLDEILAELEEEDGKMEEAAFVPGSQKAVAKGDVGTKAELEEKKKMEKELEEARKAVKAMRTELQEINLLNAKLLYVNKLLKAKPLTEAQKVKVLNAFDRATTVREAENVYKTLNESMTASKTKSALKESFGYASKPAGSAPAKPIVEVDSMVARWQTIAGIKK